MCAKVKSPKPSYFFLFFKFIYTLYIHSSEMPTDPSFLHMPFDLGLAFGPEQSMAKV